MNENDLNQESREDDRALVTSVLRRVLILDLLPGEGHEGGMEIAELQRRLCKDGIQVQRQVLMHDLECMEQQCWVGLADSQGRRWKKLLDDGVSAHVHPLAGQSRRWFQGQGVNVLGNVGARQHDGCPNFGSDIHVDRSRGGGSK